MNSSKFLAHGGDFHIRFGSRHEEYKGVFKRFYEDLREAKPRRIVLAGDLNHQKINMSPKSISLLTELLTNLIKIAPVDIIAGNHDVNLQQIDQGDTISPILETVDKFLSVYNEDEDRTENLSLTHIIDEKNKNTTDFTKRGIYYFPTSGFYNIDKDLVYGVYSCIDSKLLTLSKKESGKTYVALYHGKIYGAVGDNGYELKGDDLIKMSTFNNFDICAFSDIHEYQSFRNDTAAYSSSLVQQSYAESINKGYLLWDLETHTHVRRFILNDYGFAKISIARGESVEERIENIQFSNNKKKTKVYITWEDYEENYSREKENQITKMVKDKYGCEVVNVEFTPLEKARLSETEEGNLENQDTFIASLKKFIQEGDFDCDEDLLSDIIEYANETEKALEIKDEFKQKYVWDIDSFEVCNIFSFGPTPIYINVSELGGITGIFGENYNGKSNLIKSLVWGLFQEVVGSNNAKKLVNIYSGVNKGYVKIYLTIAGEKYFINRQVKTTKKKDGSSENSYPSEFKKKIVNEAGDEEWVSEVFEKGAIEKKQVKEMIFAAVGIYDDFTKVSLQIQGGKDDYINQQQQPKNDLINRYMGLESFRVRYDYVNKLFNSVKKKQKEIGSLNEIQELVNNCNIKITQLTGEINNLNAEKQSFEMLKDGVDSEVMKLTKALEKVEKLKITDKNHIDQLANDLSGEIINLQNEQNELSQWLSVNFKQQVQVNTNKTVQQLESDFKTKDKKFQSEKSLYQTTELWLSQNQKLDPVIIDGVEDQIIEIRTDINTLNGYLPVYRGEVCKYCGHQIKQADPLSEQNCLADINAKQLLLNQLNGLVFSKKTADTHNQKYDLNVSELSRLKSSLTSLKLEKESIKNDIDALKQLSDILAHNQLVENKSQRASGIPTLISNKGLEITELINSKTKIDENVRKEQRNSVINEDIKEKNILIVGYKQSIYNFSQQILTKSGDLRVEQNNLENYETKLAELKEAEKTYKKYSIYLQAVDRDGIPSRIIRNKLPIVNNKINSILKTIVNFKIELDILSNGDIVDCFYYSNDKSDALPLSGSGSGSQKFIGSIVIKDALHYISNLPKPSISIIDEGFGTLDDKNIAGIVNVLYYLKNKYKNVFIVTHMNEIKDFVDHSIEVYKTKDGIPKELLEKNEEAGISYVNVT